MNHVLRDTRKITGPLTDTNVKIVQIKVSHTGQCTNNKASPVDGNVVRTVQEALQLFDGDLKPEHSFGRDHLAGDVSKVDARQSFQVSEYCLMKLLTRITPLSKMLYYTF